ARGPRTRVGAWRGNPQRCGRRVAREASVAGSATGRAPAHTGMAALDKRPTRKRALGAIAPPPEPNDNTRPSVHKELCVMTIVPRPRASFHSPTSPFAGRRWANRVYPGDLAQASWVREDLRSDLYRIEGLCPDLTDTVILCASEMFSN